MICLLRHFNPLIPQREIQQYRTKIGCHILAVLPKIYLFSLSAAPGTLIFSRTNRRNNIYPGANPPYFLCELPVRTMIIFAIHNHLLRSYRITSSVFMYLLYQNGNNQIFLHVKIRRSKLRLIFFVDFLFIISPRLQCNFRLK